LRGVFSGAIFPFASAILSGLWLALAFPDYDIWWCGWMALVPLLVGLQGRHPLYGFLLGWTSAFVFFPAIGRWLFEVPAYSLVHHVVWDSYLSIFCGLFGAAYSLISRRKGAVPALLAAPFLWVFSEYLRSNAGFMAFPWGLLAHSQHERLTVIQISALTGNYGVSYLMASVNAALAAMALSVLRGRRSPGNPPRSSLRGGVIATTAIAALLTLLSLAYGHVILSKPLVGEGIMVSVVQGNIEQSRKWDPQYARSIIRTYADITDEASREHPDLIVWPEAATPYAVDRDMNMYKLMRRITEKAGTPLLVGSSSRQKFTSERDRERDSRNSAFLFIPGSAADMQRYDKIHLLPFAEYLPLKGKIPWSVIRIADPPHYVPGDKFTVFQGPDYRFGVTICWETIFPELVRQFVLAGGQFIVNITNEAWFGKTESPHQFVSMNIFRAVENRRYVVRCGNTGVSCFIDPRGRVIGRIQDEKGQDTFLRGLLTERVIPLEASTFYTRHGDWFALLCAACSAILTILALFGRNRGAGDSPRPLG